LLEGEEERECVRGAQAAGDLELFCHFISRYFNSRCFISRKGAKNAKGRQEDKSEVFSGIHGRGDSTPQLPAHKAVKWTAWFDARRWLVLVKR
jgi:hypothetical protein